jgi:hypothetical protein
LSAAVPPAIPVAADFDLGDHMLGNDAGYSALAESIDLGLFG